MSRSSDSPWTDDRWWYGRDPDPWGRDEFWSLEQSFDWWCSLPALADRLEVEDARRDVEKDG